MNLPSEDLFYVFSDDLTGKERLAAWEREYLRTGIILCRGNKTKTALYLGFTVKTLYNKLFKYPDLRKLMSEQELSSLEEQPLVERAYMKNVKAIRLNRLGEMKIKRIAKTFWFRQLPEEEREIIKTRIRKQY